MKIWIVTIGEPTLLDSKNPRLLRSSILGNKLVEKKVNVTFIVIRDGRKRDRI